MGIWTKSPRELQLHFNHTNKDWDLGLGANFTPWALLFKQKVLKAGGHTTWDTLLCLLRSGRGQYKILFILSDWSQELDLLSQSWVWSPIGKIYFKMLFRQACPLHAGATGKNTWLQPGSEEQPARWKAWDKADPE